MQNPCSSFTHNCLQPAEFPVICLTEKEGKSHDAWQIIHACFSVSLLPWQKALNPWFYHQGFQIMMQTSLSHRLPGGYKMETGLIGRRDIQPSVGYCERSVRKYSLKVYISFIHSFI